MKYITILLCLFSLSFAQLPNNSVGAKQIKKNAVRTKHLKAESVTGAKIADGTITSSKLDNFTEISPFTLTNGQSQTIFDDGLISLSARCIINDAGVDRARILVFSTVDGAALDGHDDTENLVSSSVDTQRRLCESSATTGAPDIDQETDGAIINTNSDMYNTHFVTGVNLLGETGKCYFAGNVQVIPSVVTAP